MPRPRTVFAAICLIASMCMPAAEADAHMQVPHVGEEVTVTGAGWVWPVAARRDVTVPYRAPAHRFGAGHRGIDVSAGTPGSEVLAPGDGVVAFRGTVVDRPLLTLTHAGGLVTTLEPVASSLSAGDAVIAGDIVGTLASGGHAVAGDLHLGVRLDGDYIDPMLLFGGVPRAVLLPCCKG